MSHVADRFTAILDANVLYPSLKRDVLLSFGERGLYRPRWTGMIMGEWTETRRMAFRLNKVALLG